MPFTVLTSPYRAGSPVAASGGPSFTPMTHIDFDGLANGADVSSSGTAGKRFDSWGTYGNGYGSIATTSEKMSGKTSSCAINVRDESTGFPTDVDTPVGDGHFGGIVTLPSGLDEGTELWLGAWMKPAAGMDFQNNVGGLKFFRLSENDTAGRVETLISGDGVGWWYHTGTWGLLDQSYTRKTCDRNMVRDEWNWVEMYVKLSFDHLDCIRRFWVNGDLVYERTLGTVNKWFQNGIWNTQDFDGLGGQDGPERLLFSETSRVTELLFPCTYWNGGAPGDQIWYCQEIVAHSTPSDLTDRDEFDNIMIGNQATFLP